MPLWPLAFCGFCLFLELFVSRTALFLKWKSILQILGNTCRATVYMPYMKWLPQNIVNINDKKDENIGMEYGGVAMVRVRVMVIKEVMEE